MSGQIVQAEKLCALQSMNILGSKKRTAGEQNICWNTELYVQSAQRQQTKEVGGRRAGRNPS
jgi:hypothetical protein